MPNSVRETWGNLVWNVCFLIVPNRVRDLKSILLDMCVFYASWIVWNQELVLIGRCGASFSSNTKTNSFWRATLISTDVGQTKTLKKGFYVTWNTTVKLFCSKRSFGWLILRKSDRNSIQLPYDQKREPLSLYFESSMTTFLSFVGCFRPKPSEPMELIQCCRIFYTTRTVDLNTYKLRTEMNLGQEFVLQSLRLKVIRERRYHLHSQR